MKPFNGYEAKDTNAGGNLPTGAYVAKILKAEVISAEWGDRLVIHYDVAEGERQDFFAHAYRAADESRKKWKGVYRLNVPKNNGDEYDHMRIRTFNGAMWCIEQSNPGYKWDWNEGGLAGKLVGVTIREFDWEMPERELWGTSTECGRLECAEDVRAGKTKPMKKRELKNRQMPTQEAASDANGYTEVTDDDLPF